MKKFHFIADCTFEAENIDDAMLNIADHFTYIVNNALGEELQFVGKMEIKLCNCLSENTLDKK